MDKKIKSVFGILIWLNWYVGTKTRVLDKDGKLLLPIPLTRFISKVYREIRPIKCIRYIDSIRGGLSPGKKRPIQIYYMKGAGVIVRFSKLFRR